MSVQKLRFSLDPRLNGELLHSIIGDGGALSFKDQSFGNSICFDALHHMKDYPKTLEEMYRILVPGGRAIFIEPGAKHSTSEETRTFLGA